MTAVGALEPIAAETRPQRRRGLERAVHREFG
jgi:hypothetical protein